MGAMASYQNGNCWVRLYRDGTKVRVCDGAPAPVHPESIDVKVTNFCDAGCRYCHEMSTRRGVHGDLERAAAILGQLPAGVEIAIGGGNPLSHPDLVPFLEQLRAGGIVPNLTVNQLHLAPFAGLLDDLRRRDLVFGLGISYRQLDAALSAFIAPRTVVHLIAGVQTPDDLTALSQRHPQATVLLLGYKQVGRGIRFYSDAVAQNLRRWHEELPRFLHSGLTLSFDNLAIAQLGVRRLFTDAGWQRFYMGDDGTMSMYMDMVRQEFAPMSTSATRTPIGQHTVREMFAAVRAVQEVAA